MSLKDNLLDEPEELKEFQRVVKEARKELIYIPLIIFSVFIFTTIVLSPASFNAEHLICYLIVTYLIKIFYEIKQPSYIYDYQFTNYNITLHLTNVSGSKKEIITIDLNTIKSSRLITLFSTKKGKLMIESFSKTYTFQVRGKESIRVLSSSIRKAT